MSILDFLRQPQQPPAGEPQFAPTPPGGHPGKRKGLTAEQKMAMAAIGSGLVNLGNNQPVNLMPAIQAIQSRRQQGAFGESISGGAYKELFTDQERAALMDLAKRNPELAESIAMKRMFGAAPEPMKGVNVNGRLVNPVTGAVIYEGETEQPDPWAGVTGAQLGLDADMAAQFDQMPPGPEKTKLAAKIAAGRFEQPDQTGANDAATTLRKEYLGLPAVKAFQDQAGAYGRVIASANDPSPAGDLALIFNFMKVLDPGSTVREGEFATAAASGAFGDRIQAAVNQVQSGTRLSEDQRADFLKRAESLYTDAQRQYDSLSEQYTGRATRQGLDPQDAVTDFSYVGSNAPEISPMPTGRPDMGGSILRPDPYMPASNPANAPSIGGNGVPPGWTLAPEQWNIMPPAAQAEWLEYQKIIDGIDGGRQ